MGESYTFARLKLQFTVFNSFVEMLCQFCQSSLIAAVTMVTILLNVPFYQFFIKHCVMQL